MAKKQNKPFPKSQSLMMFISIKPILSSRTLSKNLFFLLYFVFTACNASQITPIPPPILPEGWQRIELSTIGSIDIPKTLKVEATIFSPADKKVITAQNNGLIEIRPIDPNKYARVMIESIKGNTGDYGTLFSDISTITKQEISELNIKFRQFFEVGDEWLKVVEWYPLKVEKINEMSCIHLNYKRQLKNNPIVLVHMYIFDNSDSRYNITLSYRLSEANFWEPDFKQIISSFRVAKIN